MIIRFGVLNYESIGDGQWSPTPTYILDAFDVSCNTALGETRDTFSFKIPNNRNGRITAFDPQDNVNIYLQLNGASIAGSNLILNGLIKNVKEDINDKGKFLRIEGISFGEISTNALVFYNTATSHSENVMQFLEHCLTSVQLRNGNFGVTWDSSNPSTKINGDSFPVLNSGLQVKEFDVSLGSLLNKYLQNEYTADGRYYWYINNSKELVIRPRDNNIKNSITESVDFKSARFDVNSDDVRNFIVVKCGFDNDNNPISTRYDDPVSRAKYGFKYYMLVDTQIAQKLKETGRYTGDNAQLIIDAKAIGLARATAFATAHNKGFKTISIIMKPTVEYAVGDKLSITSPSYNLLNAPMRIKEISWDIDSTNILLVEEVAV